MNTDDPRPYSKFDYGNLQKLWACEYCKQMVGVDKDIVFHQLYGSCDGVFFEFYIFDSVTGKGFMHHVYDQRLYREFANACLNGEVPGVWWE